MGNTCPFGNRHLTSLDDKNMPVGPSLSYVAASTLRSPNRLSLNCFESTDIRRIRAMGQMPGPGIHCLVARGLFQDVSYGAYLLNPHPPRNLTLYPFSTPLWNLTNVKPRKTWPRTRSFPAFNPAIPRRLSSMSCETKSQLSIKPRIETMDSRNGSPRL